MLSALDNDPKKLVIDLSCRRVGEGWRVAMDRWQTITDFEINKGMWEIIPPKASTQIANEEPYLVPNRKHRHARALLQ